jgi:hypothetical protein
MKYKRLLLSAFVLFTLGCALLSELNPVETESQEVPTADTQHLLPPACISDEPTQQDVDRALDFTGGLFSEGDWERSYFVSDGRVGVTWLNNSIGAVAYLEALIFICGYEEADLDSYFSPANWAVIFEDYDLHEVVSQCTAPSGLRLYEIDAINLGFDYNIRYWARNDGDNRVITVMMTFPESAEDLLDDYAASLFPNLPHCP